MKKLAGWILALLVLLLVQPAWTQDLEEKVRIHGFGGWAAGITDGNQYLAGEEDREYDSISFTLSTTATVSDELTVNGQIHFDSVDEEIKTDLDFAFAQWSFSDQLKLRGGLVKHPFGIYTEIFDVGTIRPFFDLPQGIYGPSEFIAEAYQGLGLTGHKELGSGWALGYDLYGGELGLDSTEAANPLIFGEDEGEGGEGLEPEEKIKDVLGGRLKLNTPGGKLSFGVSAYFGTPEKKEEEGEAEIATTHEVYGVHAEYLSSLWSLRLEYAHREGGDEDVEVDAAYLEIARFVGGNWQLGARYDWSDYTFNEDDAVRSPSLREHEDRAVAVNYWLSNRMVFKLSYHFVDGNFFALPEGDDDPESETKLIQLGLQFSF